MTPLEHTYSSSARRISSTAFGGSSSSGESRLLMTAGMIDLDLSKSAANDCNKNARKASDARMLIGSNALKKKFGIFLNINE